MKTKHSIAMVALGFTLTLIGQSSYSQNQSGTVPRDSQPAPMAAPDFRPAPTPGGMQTAPVPGSSAAPVAPRGQGLLQEMKDLVKNAVQINVNDEQGKHVHVKVPFVNVDVKDGQHQVQVNAPFVHVNRGADETVSVKAPFVNINKPSHTTNAQPTNGASTNSQSNSAPSTGAQPSTATNNDGKSVAVKAPFTSVTKDDHGISVKAPLVNVEKH